MEYTIYHVLKIKVGCTENLVRRTRENNRLYGKDIEIIVLEITNDLDLADKLENKYSIKLGYGEILPHLRYKVRRQFGKMHTGRDFSKEHREKLTTANIGRVCTTDTREKMSKAHKGKAKSLEQIEKTRLANTGKRRGTVYIEYTTGYTGTALDISRKFKCYMSSIPLFVKRNKPISRGSLKGLHFAIYSKDI